MQFYRVKLFVFLCLALDSSELRTVKAKTTVTRQIVNNSPSINAFKNNTFQSDVYLETPDFAKKYGYPVESHVIQTDDGYILTVHRIPRGRASASNDSRVRAPVLLLHGLQATSEEWIALGPDKGLGFILADAGYDVWLINHRGNFYSRKHATLSPKNPTFWNFTWHEMGNNDLPAVIDYIIDKTNQKQIFLIGHSMGTNVLFSLMSTQPAYNEKIRLVCALTPSIYYKYQNNMFAEVIKYGHLGLDGFFRAGQYEALPRNPSIAKFGEAFCGDGQIGQTLCALIYYYSVGNEVNDQLNKSALPVFFGHYPAGSSLAAIDHFVQNFNSGRFQLYDRTRSNRRMPEYDLSQVSAPVAMYYSSNDAIVHPDGVVRLSKELPNVVGMFKVPDKYKFNHIDLALGIDAKKVIFDDMLSLMKKY